MRPWRKRFNGHRRNTYNRERRRCRLERIIRPEDIERHHRRPRKLGGSNHESNISYVRGDKHGAWNTLFGSRDAPQLFDVLLNFWHSFGEDISRNNIINRRVDRKRIAWMTLFENTEPEKIADIINNIWIDPAFKTLTTRNGLSGAQSIMLQHHYIVRFDTRSHRAQSQPKMKAA
mgnify:FL=1